MTRQDEGTIRIVTRVRLIKNGQEREVEVSEIEDISNVEKFSLGYVRGATEPIRVIFKDGNVELFDDCQPIV